MLSPELSRLEIVAAEAEIDIAEEQGDIGLAIAVARSLLAGLAFAYAEQRG